MKRCAAILPDVHTHAMLVSVDEPEGIYRGEVTAIMGALADVHAYTRRILDILQEEDDDEHDEEEEENA